MKNTELAKGGNISVQVQQNREHIEELRKQNMMMAYQNKMIADMAANGNGSVAVISTQMSDQQILEAINRNPDVLYSIINKGRSLGYR